MFSKVFIVVAFASLAIPIKAIVYDKCYVANALRQHGIPEDQIATWVCIANAESHFDTTAVNQQTLDYGIFQISSIYWCNDADQPGKGCDITCKSLLEDDISEDIECIKVVFAQTEQQGQVPGFKAWTTYEPNCAGDNSQWVQGC